MGGRGAGAMKTLSMVVPCRNEARRLDQTAFVEAVEKWPWMSFCFVDDGSTDSTAEILAHLVNLHPAFHAIYLPSNVGKAEAVRAGMRHVCANTHADFAGFWDADLATPLCEVPRFMRIFDKSPETKAVIGSRWPHLGADIRRTAGRGLAGGLAKLIIRRVLGAQVWDTQCGAKIFARELADAIFRDRFRLRWLFDVELLLRLGKRLKSEVRECPLECWFDVPGSNVGLSALGELLALPFLRLGVCHG